LGFGFGFGFGLGEVRVRVRLRVKNCLLTVPAPPSVCRRRT